ncbi:MAG: hypothetical protein H8E28_06645 [Anaerolineae bacterium]|nr:hypothetical protein [Anaerolineae bacterium]MBL6965224.1 hypothetical protein [Anaerolineales bacterium]
MDIGMLWFDNDKNSELNTKVERAAAYYQRKYGQSPNICFVHPSMIPVSEKQRKAAVIELRTSQSLLPNHFWLGIYSQ